MRGERREREDRNTRRVKTHEVRAMIYLAVRSAYWTQDLGQKLRGLATSQSSN